MFIGFSSAMCIFHWCQNGLNCILQHLVILLLPNIMTYQCCWKYLAAIIQSIWDLIGHQSNSTAVNG